MENGKAHSGGAKLHTRVKLFSPLGVTRFLVYLSILLVLFTSPLLLHQLHPRQKKIQAFERVARHLLSRLENKTILGQILLLYLPPNHTKTIFHTRPGTLFIQRKSIPQKNNEPDNDALRRRLARIQNAFKARGVPPPFIAVDQEFGRVQWIRHDVHEFPAPMAMGNAVQSGEDLETIYWVGFHSCSDLKRFHINWPLAPVADIHDNEENPVIGTRSFGSDPELVSKILRNYVEGLHDAGCMDALKHFPGHGGTSHDSHKELPVVEKSFHELTKKELVPFRFLAPNSSAVMLGHILLPQVDPETATFSPRWINQHLKREMGFKGLIMTDDLGMRAVTPILDKKHIINSVQRAMEAGVDILLLANGTAQFAPYIFNLLLKKMKSLEFKKKVISSVSKILVHKLKYGLYRNHLEEKLKQNDPAFPGYVPKEVREAMLQVITDNDEKEKRREVLRKKAPQPQVINQALSQGGIRYLLGRHHKIIPEKSRLFTNVSAKDLPCLQKARFKKAYLSFDLLPGFSLQDKPKPRHPENGMETVILYEGSQLTPNMKKYLRLQNRPRITFLTTANPFPYSKLGAFFRKNDSLIASFSNSFGSRKALRKFFCKKL